MIFIGLTSEFGWVLLAAALVAFECVLIGALIVGGARRKAFPEEFMKNFEKEHTEFTG